MAHSERLGACGRRQSAGSASDPKNDANFLLHQKADDGNGKLDRGLAAHLGVPDNFADWHWATQLNQARAVTYAIDHYRRWWPRTAGAIVWQLNDCWPVTSWAAIDFEERPKPLWYALRRAFAPRNLVFASEDGILSVVLLNDTDQPWRGELRLSREQLDGEILATITVQVNVEPRTAMPIALPDALSHPQDRTVEIVVARIEGVTSGAHVRGGHRARAGGRSAGRSGRADRRRVRRHGNGPLVCPRCHVVG